MDANKTVAGSWGVMVDRMRVQDNVIGTERYYVSYLSLGSVGRRAYDQGSLDPGFDAIYVPDSLAEDIFSRVPDAQRDGTDTGRWVSNLTLPHSYDGECVADRIECAVWCRHIDDRDRRRSRVQRRLHHTCPAARGQPQRVLVLHNSLAIWESAR